MTIEVAQWILRVLAAYLGLGALFAAVFVAFGVSRIDSIARGMPWSARLLVVPGSLVLWPLLLFKWLTGTEPPLT